MNFLLSAAYSSESANSPSDTNGSDGPSSEEDYFLKTKLHIIIRETIAEEELQFLLVRKTKSGKLLMVPSLPTVTF